MDSHSRFALLAITAFTPMYAFFHRITCGGCFHVSQVPAAPPGQKELRP